MYTHAVHNLIFFVLYCAVCAIMITNRPVEQSFTVCACVCAVMCPDSFVQSGAI